MSARGLTAERDLAASALGWLAAAALRALGATWRVETTGRAPARAPYVLAAWHQGLLVAAYLLRDRGLWVPLSLSRDGDLAERALRRLGFACSPRGSSSRGGSALLREMIRRIRAGESGGVLPDGPRGPAFEAKPGVLALAAATGVQIVPVGVAAAPCGRLGSWDRALVPLPFARVRVVYGNPIEVPKDASAAQREEYRRQLTSTLQALDLEAERSPQRT
jgi:hypothetical protein